MRLEIFLIALAVVLLAFVIEVVRRRRLSEGFALLWIAVGIGGLVVGLARHLIDTFSDTIGVSYGVNLVFAFAFVFLVVVSVILSIHVSKLEDQVAALAEEVALVKGPQGGTPAGPGDDEPVETPA